MTKQKFIVWIICLIGFFGLLLISRNIFKTRDVNTSYDYNQTANLERIKCEDIQCLTGYFLTCEPSEYKYTAKEGSISFIVYGWQGSKCHFQTKGTASLPSDDCFFDAINLNAKTLNQLFGNEEGLQYVIDQSCS